MKLETSVGDRSNWILELAQSWLMSSTSTDVTVTCGTRDFPCHKIIILPFIHNNISRESLEDADQIILQEVTPQQFEKCVKFAYGFQEENAPQEDKGIFNFNGHSQETETDLPENPITTIKVKIEAEDDDDYIDTEASMSMDIEENAININPLFLKTEVITDEPQVVVPKKKRAAIAKFCPECDKMFMRGDKLKAHFLAMHPDKEFIPPWSTGPYPCSKCDNLVFPTRLLRKKHMRKVHWNDKPLEKLHCELCGMEFKSKKKLLVHQACKHRSYKCSCGIEFKKQQEFYEHRAMEVLGEHELIIEGPGVKKPMTIISPKPLKTISDKWHPCTHCHEAYPSTKELRHHMFESHWAELKEKKMIYSSHGQLLIKTLNCHYADCDVYFKDNIDRDNHIRMVHTNEKVYCEICCKEFRSTKTLRIHMVTKHPPVNEEKVCHTCGETFENNKILMSHQKIHQEKIRKHKCRFCDYDTYAKPQLREHERTHTGEKPEICSYCNQGFTSKKTLKNHIRLHTGEKPYKCKFCDASFVQRTGLNVHIQTHHKEYANDEKVRKYNYHKKPGRAGPGDPKSESMSIVSSPVEVERDHPEPGDHPIDPYHQAAIHQFRINSIASAGILANEESHKEYANEEKVRKKEHVDGHLDPYHQAAINHFRANSMASAGIMANAVSGPPALMANSVATSGLTNEDIIRKFQHQYHYP